VAVAPPLIISDDEILELVAALTRALRVTEGQLLN
jgi:adenosylmethionine-8-amino-7-oxononanoate aminotransferase